MVPPPAHHPVGAGVVQSLAHPGGYFTGIFNSGADHLAKNLQLLRELLPQAGSVAFLVDLSFPPAVNQMYRETMTAAAKKLDFEPKFFVVNSGEELPSAFDQMAEVKADGLFINTAGVGVLRIDWQLGQTQLQPGDKVLLSGPVGNHGIAIMLAREALAAGRTSAAEYLKSRPIVAEVEATARAICLAEETGCALHVVHVSNSRSSELVRLAAARGANVTCETCPHYLVLNEHDVARLGPPAKCAPPAGAQRSSPATCARSRRWWPWSGRRRASLAPSPCWSTPPASSRKTPSPP